MGKGPGLPGLAKLGEVPNQTGAGGARKQGSQPGRRGEKGKPQREAGAGGPRRRNTGSRIQPGVCVLSVCTPGRCAAAALFPGGDAAPSHLHFSLEMM